MLSDHHVKELLLDPQTDWFYLGEVDEDLIGNFVYLVESRPDFVQLPRPSRRRLLSAVVECLQNIRNNTPVITSPKAGSAIFMQRFSRNEYGLICGNMMETAEVENLKTKLDRINGADSESLRQMYMEQMDRALQSGSRTNAGLGLLEIARAVNGPINYKFVPLESGHTFFCVELLISLN